MPKNYIRFNKALLRNTYISRKIRETVEIKKLSSFMIRRLLGCVEYFGLLQLRGIIERYKSKHTNTVRIQHIIHLARIPYIEPKYKIKSFKGRLTET